jgi:MFS family permease
MALSHFLLPAADSFAILLLIGLVNGVGNGLASGIVMTMGSDLAPERRAGEFLSLWFLFSSVGRVFGPSIIGLLSDVFTLGAASIVSAGIGVAGATFMLFFVADTLKKKAT